MTTTPSSAAVRPAYFASITGGPVLTLPRSTWEAMKPEALVKQSESMSYRCATFACVVRDAIVLAAMAERFTSTGSDVVVYRDDPNDARSGSTWIVMRSWRT